MQTKLGTYDIVPNNNISFPIGTILTVEQLCDLLDLPTVFGKHKEEIMYEIQDLLFENYDFKHTNINKDWTSIVLHGVNPTWKIW